MEPIMYADLNDQQRALVDDGSTSLRQAAAIAGFGLDKLVNDPEDIIREEVERQGFAMDEPAQMMSEYERAVARNRLIREGMKAKQPAYPNKMYADLSENERVLVNHERCAIRKIAAQQGWGVDKLVNDPDPNVRAAVAERSYGLNILMDDPHWYVRCAVAHQGFAPEKLAYDPEWTVRSFVAQRGEYLAVLVNDPSPQVRAEVARHGFGLDQLANDPNLRVRMAIDEWTHRAESAARKGQERSLAEELSQWRPSREAWLQTQGQEQTQPVKEEGVGVQGVSFETDNLRVEIAGESRDVEMSAFKDEPVKAEEQEPRKPGALKSAKGKPKGAWFSGKFSIGEDLKACVASASARVADARKPSADRNKNPKQ